MAAPASAYLNKNINTKEYMLEIVFYENISSTETLKSGKAGAPLQIIFP